jgi:hypothetical protein
MLFRLDWLHGFRFVECSFLATCLRTLFHEETALLSVCKFAFLELIPINASGVAVGSLSAIQHGMPRASAGVPLRTLG